MVAWLTILCAPAAGAQQSLTAANGTTSIATIRGTSAVTVDVTNAAADVTLKSGDATLDWNRLNNAKLAITTTSNGATLYSGGRLTPGVQAEDRFTLMHYGGHYVPNSSGYSGYERTGDIEVGYLSIGGSVADKLVANYTDTSRTTIKTGDRAAATLTIGAGANYKPAADIGTFGLGITASHNWATPLPLQPEQVCVTQATGKSTTGKTITAAQCASRYFGPIRNLNSGQPRLDYVSKRFYKTDQKLKKNALDTLAKIPTIASSIARVSDSATRAQDLSKRASAHVDSVHAALTTRTNPSPAELANYVDAQWTRDKLAATASDLSTKLKQLKDDSMKYKKLSDSLYKAAYSSMQVAMISAFSMDIRDRSRTAYNVAVGPGLFPPLKPDNIYGALLFGFNDFTNASGQLPSVGERFVVKFYVGVPF